MFQIYMEEPHVFVLRRISCQIRHVDNIWKGRLEEPKVSEIIGIDNSITGPFKKLTNAYVKNQGTKLSEGFKFRYFHDIYKICIILTPL